MCQLLKISNKFNLLILIYINQPSAYLLIKKIENKLSLRCRQIDKARLIKKTFNFNAMFLMSRI
jgi:hypothetical protein